MYKLRRVYICDACDAASLPHITYAMCGATFKKLPHGWEEVGKLHFCSKCYEAYRAAVKSSEQQEGKQ